jgi:TRAP-type C4-dicarboxylate transport system permease small subunit
MPSFSMIDTSHWPMSARLIYASVAFAFAIVMFCGAYRQWTRFWDEEKHNDH